LDKLKDLGFKSATRAGVSIGINDMIIPEEKPAVIEKARGSVSQVEKQYRMGAITDGERYNKIVDIWTQATEEISSAMYRTLEHNEGRKDFNPVYLMVDSGARGNRNQVRQLAGYARTDGKTFGRNY
jgi:DNA-directed RNA polymerase subunit beta'